MTREAFLWWLAVVVCLSSWATLSGAAGGGVSPLVLQLSEDNFDQTVAAYPDGIFLMFHAPWCGHCRRLEPEFDQAAQAMVGRVPFAMIDCTENPGLKRRFEIRGFPTLLFSRRGEYRPYKGQRTKEALVEFGDLMSQPPVTEVSTAEELRKILRAQPVVFALFRASDSERKVFESVASVYHGEIPFLTPATEEAKGVLLEEFGLPKNTALVRFASGDEPKVYNRGEMEVEQVKAWAKANRFPPLIMMAPSVFGELTDTGRRLVFVAFDSKDTKQKEGVIASAEEVARLDLISREEKGEVGPLFVAIDGIQYSRYLVQFGVSSDQLPCVFAFDFTSDRYFRLAELDVTSSASLKQSLSDYIKSVREGKVEAVDLHPWYSPSQWARSLNRFLSGYDKTTLIAFTIGVSIAFLAVLFGISWIFTSSPTSSGPSSKRRQAIRRKIRKAKTD